MSKTLQQSNAVIVVAFMYADSRIYNLVKNEFVASIGTIEKEAEPFDFSHSSYYESEMGSSLKKSLVAFSILQKRDKLVDIKQMANAIEKKYSTGDCRQINIDPAILTLENFVLATNKNFTHRIYLKDNIFADLTLVYKKKKGYSPLEWTYLDYKSDYVVSFLNEVRSLFFDRLLESSPYQ